jgi:23S rRNA pseudouridine1911/1915/1917 synthase
MEKAYKILARQKEISNKKAKELIDRGLVYIGDKKVKIARAEVDEDTHFRVEIPDDIEIIYQDESLIVINKPPFVDSYEIEKAIDGAKLLHRLDKETSGVMLLARDEYFFEKAIEEFKKRRVKKSYVAWVEGIVAEEFEIDLPILTIKGNRAISKIDKKRGKPAFTKVFPDIIQGKKSRVNVQITTGRTHQIRLHLSAVGHPIVGDEFYGSRTKAKRVLLHSHKIELLGNLFEAPLPKDIRRYK